MCPLDLMGWSMGMMTCWPSFSAGSSARFSAMVLPAAGRTGTVDRHDWINMQYGTIPAQQMLLLAVTAPSLCGLQ